MTEEERNAFRLEGRVVLTRLGLVGLLSVAGGVGGFAGLSGFISAHNSWTPDRRVESCERKRGELEQCRFDLWAKSKDWHDLREFALEVTREVPATRSVAERLGVDLFDGFATHGGEQK